MYRQRFSSGVPVPPGPQPAASATAFVLCPLACLPPPPLAQGQWQHALYAWAFEQAQAVVRPSLPERDLLAVWN